MSTLSRYGEKVIPEETPAKEDSRPLNSEDIKSQEKVTVQEPQEKSIIKYNQSEEEPVATPPIKVELSLSRAPALNEITELTATIWYTSKIKENMSETIANITLPNGFELISGNLTWIGYIKNEPQQFSIKAKAILIGNWTIKAKIKVLGKQGTGFDYLYVSVLEDKGLISKEPFPSPKIEDSDSAIKINNSEVIKEVIPNKDIITPQPTVLGDEPPQTVKLSLLKAPKLGEIAELTTTIWYSGKIKANMLETVANITLPNGFELISGNLTWIGYIKNEPQEFSIKIKAIQIGNWTIKAKIKVLGKQGTGFDYLYVSILEDKGIINTEYIPLPKREGSDNAIKLNDSTIIPRVTPRENIIAPKPTIQKQNISEYSDAVSFLRAIAKEDIVPANNPRKGISFSSSSTIMLDPGTVTVEGRLVYEDRNGNDQPLRWVTVQIWDEDDLSGDDLLDEVLTDTNGDFESNPINNVDPEYGTQDIYVRFITTSSAAEVDGSTSGENVYDGFTSTTDNVPDGTHDIGTWSSPTADDEKPAWWVYENILDGWDYFRNVANPYYEMPKQIAQWQYDHSANFDSCQSGTHYHNDGEIHLDGRDGSGLGGGHANDEDVILHEYGHSIMYEVYGNMPSVSNCNPHWYTDESSTGCAWVEGWAEFVPLAVFNDEDFTDTTYDANYDLESRTPDNPWDEGDEVEGNVAASLWDLFDDDSEDDYDGNFNDNVWDTFMDQNDDTFPEYWDDWQAYHSSSEEDDALSVFKQNTIYYYDSEVDCADNIDEDDDGYTDCADGDCTQGESCGTNHWCCGSGCSTNGGSCSCAGTGSITCVDSTCNAYNEACCNGELERTMQCSGTSLVCTGGQGSCEYTTCGAPQYCDEITPGDSACENSPGSYDELACELSGTNCYYEAEFYCTAPSGCDEKSQNACSTNSGFQCEWQDTYTDNVIEECDSSCGASNFCNEKYPGDESTSTDECCYGSCTSLDCDNDDDTSGSDGTLKESEVTTSSCTSDCSSYSTCCNQQSITCSAVYECDYFHNLISNEDETPNNICYRSNSGNWMFASSADATETVCSDGYDNDCDGNIDNYDSDCGITDNPPTVTLNSPQNNNISTTGNILFNCTITDSINCNNLSLYFGSSSNFTLNQTVYFIGPCTYNAKWQINLTNGDYIWNCLAYDNASQYDWGDTNYSLKVNISGANLQITSFQSIYSQNTSHIFEFIVQNTGGINLSNISWAFNLGNGIIINSTQNISLDSGKSAFVYVQYNYSSKGNYVVTATVHSENLTDSATLSLGDLLITNLTEIYTNEKSRIYEFIIRNNGSTTLTNINWSLNTQETTIYAKQLTNLTSSEEMQVYVSYTFTGISDFIINATAFNSGSSYSRTINSSVNLLDVSNLAVLNSSGSQRIFEFFITNRMNTTLANINWTIKFGNNISINSFQLTSLLPNNNTFVYVDYTYPSSGSYVVNATAWNNTVQDSDTININV